MNRIIELELGYRPEAAVSGGLLLQSENDAVFMFNAMERRTDGYYHNAGIGILDITAPFKTKFGLPNDEARPGHPLYDPGLSKMGYGFAEVFDSQWIVEEETMNRVQFPNWSLKGVRHIVVLMHDSTFEFIAKDFKLAISGQTTIEILAIYARRFGFL